MVSEENTSVVTLAQDLCSYVWKCEHKTDMGTSTLYCELPRKVKKKMVSRCYDILLKENNLCYDDIERKRPLQHQIFQHFYKRGHCDDHDKELYNKYIEDLDNISAKYEGANAVFTLIAALSGSKPRRKIKPKEMLSCFYFGSLKHCVPPDQRFQTLQDQFDIVRTDSNANSLMSPTSSFSSHNPFRIPRHFEFITAPILLQEPLLNVNVPRSLHLQGTHQQVIHQDEGYVTPDSANILDDNNSRDQKKHWPEPLAPTPYSTHPPSWNTLDNVTAQREADFVLDFRSSSSSKPNKNTTGVHLVQVLQSGTDTPSPVDIKLFTHLRNQEEFMRDLTFLLMGTPSYCFPYDEEKNQFTCAYGIYTDHVSPESLVKYLEPALQCGNHAYMLKHLVRDKTKGYVYLSFHLCIQEYLRLHDTEILSHLSPDSNPRYIELQDFIASQYRRLSCLAQLWRPGTHLLNHIYGQALDSFFTNQNAELNVMVARIFECCTNTYFELLEKWLYRGDCHDSLVTQSSCHSLKSRLFWVKGFRFNKTQCPVFLLDHEDQIFACGRNICLLKLTNPEDPLFSIEMSKLPQMKCYLTKESVEEFYTQCKQYEQSVIEACGEAPQLAKLLVPLEYSQEQLRQWQEQAKVKREIYIQKLQDERMKKRELQAEQRRKMLQEIENIELRKKQEKENELKQDLKIMEEAKRLDEEYVKVKEQEKHKIEEYYKSLMEMIEKRHEHVRCKTKSLEAMKSILKTRVSRERLGDTTDAGTAPQPPAAPHSSVTSLTGSSSKESTTSYSESSSGSSDAESLFTLDIPEPPNVEMLMKKIEEEEETILLTRETQRRLEHLKANRLQARANRNRILSSEYDVCTGEKTAKPAGRFDLKEKFMEGNTTPADQEAKDNKARSQGSGMSDFMRNIHTVEDNGERGVGKEKTASVKHFENMLEARQSAMLIKQKVLSAEYSIEVIHPAPNIRDVADGTTRESGTAGDGGTTRESSDSTAGDVCTSKVLSAREEATRNRNKVLAHEFHMDATSRRTGQGEQGQCSDATQEAKDNRERSQAGSSMSDCMTNVPFTKSEEPKHQSLSERTSQSSTSTETTSGTRSQSEISSEFTPSTTSEFLTSSDLTPGSSSHCTNSSEPTPGSASLGSNLPEHTARTCSQSVTSSSEENLVTVISKEDPCSEPSLPRATHPFKINPAWTFASLIKDKHDLDVTLVQKYLEASIRSPLYVQYRLTNDAVLRLFLHKHHLATHLITLRNYFFLLDGSFAKSLTRDLSEQIRNNLVLLLNPFKLNSILRKAVSYGTCDTKMENNLTFVIKNYDTISSLQESNVFQYISLSYRVDWPLNIILTPDALTNYDKVFVFLMQVQQVSHTLQQVFVYLKLRRKLEVDNLYIYRQINLFRHVMMQVLSAVQSYIHCSVLELPWHDMVETFKKPVTLDSVYYRHVEYVKQIIFRCLLNKRSRALTEALNAMFKTILDFYEELKKRSPEKNYENLLAIFQKFLKISLYFHDYCKKMVNVGYQEQNLDYLLHMLSLNEYFSKSIH